MSARASSSFGMFGDPGAGLKMLIEPDSLASLKAACVDSIGISN